MKRLLLLLLFIFIFCAGKTESPVETENLTKLELYRKADVGQFSNYCMNKDYRIRLKSAEAMGRIQSYEFLPLLEELSKDKNSKVRLEAVFAIGQTGDSSGVNILVNKLNDVDLNVKLRTIEALGKIGISDNLNHIYKFLESSEALLVQEAALTLGRFAYRGIKTDSMVLKVLPLLENNNPEIRWRAAYSLYRLSDLIEAQKIIKYLGDSNPLVNIYILKALSEREIKRNESKIIDLIKNPDWRVRLTAIQVLTKLKNGITCEKYESLIDDVSKYVILECIMGLGLTEKNKNSKKLETLCRTGDVHIAGEAIVSLSKIDSKKAIPIIEELISSDHWYSRMKAAEGLSYIKNDKAKEMLGELSNDEDLRVASKALSIISSLGDNYWENLLIEKLETADIAAAALAANGLGKLKSEKSIDILISVFERMSAPNEIEPMNAIIFALGEIGGEKAVHFLKINLNNKDANISRAAASSLKKITGEDYSQSVIKYSEGSNYISRVRPIEGEKCEIVTEKGSIIIKLFRKDAPLTTSNFIQLALANFYDGISFHRVVPNFVIQGGCPRGDGYGGPGYAIRCENNKHNYKRGMVGMALSGKDTGGSQFFITQSPQPHLDGKYTIFGEVIEGMNIVDNILQGDKIITIKIE